MPPAGAARPPATRQEPADAALRTRRRLPQPVQPPASRPGPVRAGDRGPAWGDLEAFTGEPLFPIARQPRIAGGGKPAILALDESGRVVVIEVKRDLDRGLVGHHGVEAFFRDWQDFTETTTPTTIRPQPRLYLIARDFEGRTLSALDFLRENAVPVTVVPVTIYEDPTGRRIVDIENDHEPTIPGVTPPSGSSPQQVAVNGRRVTVADLLDAGLLQADEPVEFIRPRLGERHTATIRGDGVFVLADGSEHQSPSLAAMRAADLVSYDGWYAWRVPRLGGTKLAELREQYVAQAALSSADTAMPQQPQA